MIHNQRIGLEMMPHIIGRGFAQVESEMRRLNAWENQTFTDSQLRCWVDEDLAAAWGKKAACRVYHICREGTHVEYVDAFAPGKPSEKPVKALGPVAGARVPSHNLYDVSQALSWVATRRRDGEERLQWQLRIPTLLDKLSRKQPSLQSIRQSVARSV